MPNFAGVREPRHQPFWDTLHPEQEIQNLTKKQQAAILRQLDVLDKDLATLDERLQSAATMHGAFGEYALKIGDNIDALRRRVRRYI